MSSITEQRIAERSFAAEKKMKKEGTFGQLLTSSWLAVRNGVDRLTAWADDDRVIFLGATGAGLVRGALYGGCIALFALAAFHFAAAAIPLVFFGSVIAGAVSYGIYDGQARLEEHINNEVANKEQGLATDKTVAAPVVAQQQEQSPVNPVYTAREDARRAQAAAAQRTPS